MTQFFMQFFPNVGRILTYDSFEVNIYSHHENWYLQLFLWRSPTLNAYIIQPSQKTRTIKTIPIKISPLSSFSPVKSDPRDSVHLTLSRLHTLLMRRQQTPFKKHFTKTEITHNEQYLYCHNVFNAFQLLYFFFKRFYIVNVFSKSLAEVLL